MKKIIFIILIFNLFFGKEVLLDRFEARGYLLEIRQQEKENTKNCYLYIFKKNNKSYNFYRTYDLLSPNGYFRGKYIESEKRYNKKGQYYFVKKKKEYKIIFFDFDKTYKSMKNIKKNKRRLVKDTIGTLHIIGGEEIKANDEMIKKEKGRGMDFYPKAFYGDELIEIILMKDGDIGVYKEKKKSLYGHISYFSKIEYWITAMLYSNFTRKYKEISHGYNPEENYSSCPQITPPKESQKLILNAKIKPYKNLAGNRIE